MNLAHSVVSRCGKTARHMNEETRNIRLSAQGRQIRLFFTISSKGGGKTELYVDIGDGDFAAFAKTMAESSRLPAMIAMSAELAKQVPEQVKHDVKTREVARGAMVRLARRKMASAPDELRDVEQLVFSKVTKLDGELRDAEQQEGSERDEEDEE